MIKRFIAAFTAVFLLVALIPSTFIKEAKAYQNSSYFSDLRVGLVTMSATSIKVTLNGSYTVNGQAYASGTTLNFSVSGTSISFNGALHNQITIEPSSKTNLLSVTSGTVTNRYMGSFVLRVLDGRILPINTIDMENYLKGVVGYEMSDFFPMEALKAQAVAARNYALTKIGAEAAKGYDLDDSVWHQVYRGYNPSFTRVISAVEQTAGQVLLHNGRLVEALYSAWHGGISEDSENVWGNFVPYLRSVQDPFEDDPWPNGNRVFTDAQIASTLVARRHLSESDTFIRLDLNSITRYKSGRVANINIIYRTASGSQLTKSITRDTTRTFLGLPSNLYTVTYDAEKGTYTFSGKGHGHGLGMSQIGAKNRAAAGQTHEQILKFYYQNSYLHNLITKASIINFNQNHDALTLGETINFNASASGGTGQGYLYKYVIKNETNIVLTRDYSSENSLEFHPDSIGKYSVEVYVKDKYSLADFDDMRTLSFEVLLKDTDIDIDTDTDTEPGTIIDTELGTTTVFGKLIQGQQLIFNTNNTGGDASAYSYKYEIYISGSLIHASSFSTSGSYSFIPEISGSYTVKVYGRDGSSTKEYDSIKEFNIEVNSKPLYLSQIPLKEGMSGSDVTALQKALITLGYNIAREDGTFGNRTRNSVSSFQRSRRLTADGVVNNATYNALNEALIERSGEQNLSF
jgi:SpoIID/LytB domain protein